MQFFHDQDHLVQAAIQCKGFLGSLKFASFIIVRIEIELFFPEHPLNELALDAFPQNVLNLIPHPALQKKVVEEKLIS